MKKLNLLVILIFAINFAIAQTPNPVNGDNSKHTDGPLIEQVYEVVLYPNPVVNNQLKITASLSIVKVEIINMIGQVVTNVKNDIPVRNMTIELNACGKGLYMTKITFEDNKSLIKKIIVK